MRDTNSHETTFTVEDLQKKIIPWYSLMPRQEDMENIKRKNDTTQGLVLVSSLIDKETNLGGICRTCEIFNVKELVIGSTKYLEDKLFQHLSVTSENWINIKEVRFILMFFNNLFLNGLI